jgi:hypothetical protein
MMIEKGTKMTEFEKNCYGMSAEDIREQYMESITARLSGLEMVAMGIMSDCQEMLNYPFAAEVNAKAAKDTIRKQMNIAKFILSEMMEQRMASV